jgi:hypothetical protein
MCVLVYMCSCVCVCVCVYLCEQTRGVRTRGVFARVRLLVVKVTHKAYTTIVPRFLRGEIKRPFSFFSLRRPRLDLDELANSDISPEVTSSRIRFRSRAIFLSLHTTTTKPGEENVYENARL